MTGPEHYREAEKILDAINLGERTEKIAASAHLAQVHATLALAAATALNDAQGGLPGGDWNAWNAAAGVESTEATS